jgi:DNA-directed RNA polymerase subunit beta'
LTRRLCDVSQDVIIRTLDCGTTDGVLAHRIGNADDTVEILADRIAGRVSLSTITDPATGENLCEFGELISPEAAIAVTKLETQYHDEYNALATDEEKAALAPKYEAMGFVIDEHGQACVRMRSPLGCELEQGICAYCYGVDLSSKKLVEVGVAVGIISAQSIGEPGTQLTMRTFHTGGVAGSATIARTNQYKTGKFIKQFLEDFSTATQTDMKDFDATKLLESQESVVKGLFQTQKDAAESDEKKQTARQLKAAQKAADKVDRDSQKLWDRSRKTFFATWTGESSGIVRVEEIFEARKQPRGKAIICPVSGTVAEIQESSFGRWVIVHAEVPTTTPLRDAYVADAQNWATTDDGYSAMERLIGQKLVAATLTTLRKYGKETVRVFYPILVPPLGKLPVQKGSRVIKGDPLTDGPLDPHDVLDLAGSHAVHDYFVENLQRVYKAQGVDINDKHVEVIIRQMMRKRQVKEPGDTPFLPGQIVDRFRFQRENNKVLALIAAGKKIKYVDPITGDQVERDPKEATATWILLGITEASLATDSFLSAASFQKTTRVLTDAAVRGKQDGLVGLKENVIIGRLIPAGTGVVQYRDVTIEVDKSAPVWATQSLTALVEAEELEDGEDLGLLDFPSLADMAASPEFDIDEELE